MQFESLESRQLMSANVSGLMLVNADTDKDIMPLTNGTVLNLATLPTKNLNVRAVTNSEAASIRFDYDSTKSFAFEDTRPFALMGDVGTTSDFNAWTPALGDHTVVAKSYGNAAGTGTASNALNVQFKVIDQPTTPSGNTGGTGTSGPTTPTTPANITRLVLVNTDTGAEVATLGPTNTNVKLSEVGTMHLTVRADTSSGTVRVKFALDGVSDYHTENAAPYALAGDNGGRNLYDAKLASGAHDVTATAFAVSGGASTAGGSLSGHFTIVDDMQPPTPPPPPPPPSGGGDTGGTTGGGSTGGTSPTAPPVAGNWHSIFTDEFNAVPDAKTWTSSLWGMTQWTEEAETYSRSALSVNNGILNMTASKTPLNGKPYTSALISTGGVGDQVPASFSFKYGYVEARMKLPAGKGLWPAFWMLPTVDANGNYRDGQGEIDIMEFIGDETHTDQLHLHHNGVWGKAYDAGVDLSKDFHTYGLDWEADHMAFFLDGKEIWRITDASAMPNVPEYLILNLAVGGQGSWPGTPDANTQFPATMQVDYVKVWQS